MSPSSVLVWWLIDWLINWLVGIIEWEELKAEEKNAAVHISKFLSDTAALSLCLPLYGEEPIWRIPKACPIK